MNALQSAIADAIKNEGRNQEANKAYLEFIKANFMMPIEAFSDESQPLPLYFQEKEQTFLPVFSDKATMDAWASEIKEDILMLTLSGVDLLKGVGDDVQVCLDVGSETFKLFTPDEIARMRSMVIKLFGA